MPKVEVNMCRDCWGGSWLFSPKIPLFVSDYTEQFVCPFCGRRTKGHVALLVDEGVLMVVGEKRVKQ